jgi:hypothetical protein
MMMKVKPACTLVTALVFAALVATAGAQAPAPAPANPGSNNLPLLAGPNLVPVGGYQGPYVSQHAPNRYPTDSQALWFSPAWSQPGAEEIGLAKQADELIHQLEAATTDLQRSEIRTKLGDILSKQFDARQKRHRQEIEALEAKVAKLKDLVNKRQASREEIVTRRLEQVLRDSQGLGW